MSVGLHINVRVNGFRQLKLRPVAAFANTQHNTAPTYGLDESLTWQKGKHLIKMGAQGVKQFRQYRIIDLGHQVQQERQLCADARNRTEPTPRGTQV